MQLRNNKGFTLVEIAIVLTIVGLIIGGIWAAASTVFNNNKAQTFSKELVQIVQNTKALYAGQGASANGSDFTLNTAYAAGIFPPEMVSAASAAGSPVIVTPFSVSPAAPGDVQVTGVSTTSVGYIIINLPQAACVQALSTLGSANNLSKLGITVLGGTSGSDVTSGGTVPVTAGAAATACTVTTPGSNTSAVTFEFNLF